MTLKHTRLSVNLNKVALLRNQRDVGYPDPLEAAKMVLAAGANGITVHPRPDARHITTDDVLMLSKFCQSWKETHDATIEFNIEGYPDKRFLDVVVKAKPDQVTLVPDAPDAKTSDHGWDLTRPPEDFTKAMDVLNKMGCRISLFMDVLEDMQAMRSQLEMAKENHAHAVELYTGPYAKAYAKAHQKHKNIHHDDDLNTLLLCYNQAAMEANSNGLLVHAGHDLSLQNLELFTTNVQPLSELSIGHAFMADALWWGLNEATKSYLNIIKHE